MTRIVAGRVAAFIPGRKDALGDDPAVAVADHREGGCLVDVEAHILRRASDESGSLPWSTCVSRPLNMCDAVLTPRPVPIRMSQLPFRWNLVQRQQLGGLLEGDAAEAYPGFVDDLRHCCTRLVASAGDSDLVFVGRSPESIFDYLSGLLSDTPFADRCTLLNLSMRRQSVEEIERENPHGLIALHELLASGGLEPRQIARSSRPITLVDLVCGGTTFGNLVGLLNHWAASSGEDIKAVRRRLRFIGITIRSKNSPNTWRWYQQVPWARQFPRSALRSIPISYLMWTYLGDEQKKVSRWYPPSEWGQEYVGTPPREEWNLQALRLAAQIHNRGRHRDERQRFASALVRQGEMRDPSLRQLVLTLRRGETA